MKTISKLITGLCIAGSLVLGLTAPADAQRGEHAADFNRTAFRMRADAFTTHFNGFYHPFIYPLAGVALRALPVGYYSFVWNSYPYYFCDGLFYQYYPDGAYRIAVPPVGAEVPSLPIDAELINIDGNPYYEYKGIYYESVIRADGNIAYKVVGKDGIQKAAGQTDPAMPLVGDMTDQLPAGSHRVTLSGKNYWVTPEDVYLEEVKKDNKMSYRVVSVPDGGKTQPQQVQENKSM